MCAVRDNDASTQTIRAVASGVDCLCLWTLYVERQAARIEGERAPLDTEL